MLRVLFYLMIFMTSMTMVYAWDGRASIVQKDLVSDSIDVPDLIIKTVGSGGTGLYYENMRIFKDEITEHNAPHNLRLVFEIRTLEQQTDMPPFSRTIREVTFGKKNAKGIVDTITVRTTHIVFKYNKGRILWDSRKWIPEKKGEPEEKIISKKDEGVKVYKWDGKKFVTK